MQPPLLPEIASLQEGLSAVFRQRRPPLPELLAVRRCPNTYASTFASEIVHCHFAGGREVALLCKYETANGGVIHQGLRYEADVYRSVVEKVNLPKAAFYGVYEEESAGRTWLVIEHLDKSTRLDLVPGRQAIGDAAHWIGRFHAMCGGAIADESGPVLRRYDAAFYDAWRRSVAGVPAHFSRVFPWLADLYANAEELLAPLALAAPTVVHADLFPDNVLIRDGRPYVVDWESAGVGAGEVDLALLTAGPWAPDIVGDCERRYRAARWPDGAPPGHQPALDAARFYVAFMLLTRWLRFPPERAAQDNWLATTLRSALDMRT